MPTCMSQSNINIFDAHYDQIKDIYTRFSHQKRFQVLQVLDIFEIWICYISKFFWPLKMTSTLSKIPTKNFGVVE